MWKDITTYRQGQKERVPTSWEYSNGIIRISITCGHIYFPSGEWVMHCPAIRMNTYETKLPKETELHIVQETAIRIVKDRLKKLYESLV
jgi:uncharacterized OB-fold protein